MEDESGVVFPFSLIEIKTGLGSMRDVLIFKCIYCKIIENCFSHNHKSIES